MIILIINTEEAYKGDGKLINSDFLNNLDISNAKNKIISVIEEKNIGKKKLCLD